MRFIYFILIFFSGRSIASWIEHYSKNYIFSEQIFIQLTSIALNRKIKLYSVKDKENRDRIIDPHEHCGCGMKAPSEPLYLLYFEDAHFASPHYQSIRPKATLTPQSPPEQVR